LALIVINLAMPNIMPLMRLGVLFCLEV